MGLPDPPPYSPPVSASASALLWCLVQDPYMPCTVTVQDSYRARTGPVQDPYRLGTGPVQDPYRTGTCFLQYCTVPVKAPYRIGTESVQAQYGNFTVRKGMGWYGTVRYRYGTGSEGSRGRGRRGYGTEEVR